MVDSFGRFCFVTVIALRVESIRSRPKVRTFSCFEAPGQKKTLIIDGIVCERIYEY
jgi:hypothetical protein